MSRTSATASRCASYTTAVGHNVKAEHVNFEIRLCMAFSYKPALLAASKHRMLNDTTSTQQEDQQIQSMQGARRICCHSLIPLKSLYVGADSAALCA